MIRANELPTPLVWIEDWPKKSTGRGEETFELVVYSSYEVIERASYLGETRAWIGDASWKRLDRTTVEGVAHYPSGTGRGPIPATKTTQHKWRCLPLATPVGARLVVKSAWPQTKTRK